MARQRSITAFAGRRAARLVLPALAAAVGTSAAVAAATTSSAEEARAARAAQRPNVVVVMTDDQTVESVRVMTNVRRLLAEQGTTFANSFATFSLCCPSRATFLTGQYAQTTRCSGTHRRPAASTSSTAPTHSQSGCSGPATTRSTSVST